MISHLDSCARVALVLALALIAMPLLRGLSAVARRLVLSLVFGFALVLPFVPSLRVDAPVVRGLVGRLVVEPIAAATDASVVASPLHVASSIDWLVIIWSLGALAVALRFAVGLVLARRLVIRSYPAPASWDSAIAHAERKMGQRPVVRISTEVEAPAVTGMLSPVVLVPASSARWSTERKVSVLLHELAHVAAYDLFVQVVATIVCSLHWFNPLAWLAMRRLRFERELAADEVVIRAGARASSYAADLLAIAGAVPAGTIAIGTKPLPARIAAIVAARRPSKLGFGGASAIAVGTAAVSLAVACTSTSEGAGSRAVSSHVAVDRDLQVMAERELDRVVKEWHASGGTILVLTPAGEVLADAGGHADRAFVVGSTMKPFLLAAAFDEDVVDETDVFDCNKGDRGGNTLHDAKENGALAVPDMLAVSSNVGFAQVFDRLGGARLDRALRRFHFSPPNDFATRPAGDWDGGLVAIGATMGSTPREVARGYAALAAGGDGIVKKTTAERVSALLEGVVTSERGTGKKARVAGVRVAGKTGTSEWTTPDDHKWTYASFVGFVPADRPRYVIFVGVESPAGEEASGGTVAAPVFSRVAQRTLTRR